MKIPSTNHLPVLAFLLIVLDVGLPSLHAARAPKPPVVVNIDTGKKYPTMQAALADAPQDEPLTLRFSGTLRESVLIFRTQEATTIIGSGKKATIDATGLNNTAITIASAKPVTLRGFTVTGGTGTETNGERRGGGIIMRGCERLRLVDMTIRGNSAEIGGGIEAGTASAVGPTVLELAGKTVVRDNQATIVGAGISADAGVTVRLLDRVSVRNNRFAPEAQNGSGGGISISGTDNAPSKLEMFAKSSVTGNFAPFLGGGIYVSGNVSVTASKGVRISGNTVEGNGGGVAATSGAALNPPTMSFDCTFLNNLATDIATSQLGRGGAIFCGAGELVLRPGARVFANKADEGGGICVFGSEIGSEVPVLKITGSVLRGNFGERAGGGIKSQGSFVFVDDSRILSNRTDRDGGGVFAGDVTSLLLSNTLVAGNLAAPSGASQSEGHGGGIALRDGAALVAQGDSKFSKNQANFSGGAISVASGATATLETGTRVELNVARLGSGGGIAVGGSSDPVGDASLALKGAVTIAGNKATNALSVDVLTNLGRQQFNDDFGGAPPPADINVDRSRFGNGGGIYFSRGKELAMTGPGIVIQDNKAGAKIPDREKAPGLDAGGVVGGMDSLAHGNLYAGVGGGGVYAEGDTQSVIQLEGVDLFNNSTTASGGGLFLRARGDSTSLREVTATGNEAVGAGGGFYSRGGGALSVTNLSLLRNFAGHQGGGMAVRPPFRPAGSPATVNISGGVIADNMATGETFAGSPDRREGRGGGVHLRDDYGAFGTRQLVVTMNGVTVEDNFSGNGAGGIGVTSARLVLDNCFIRDNVALRAVNSADGGGGLLLENRAECLISRTTISGNQSEQGSGAGIKVVDQGRPSVEFGPGVSVTGNRIFGLPAALVRDLMRDPQNPGIGGGYEGGSFISGTAAITGNIPSNTRFR